MTCRSPKRLKNPATSDSSRTTDEPSSRLTTSDDETSKMPRGGPPGTAGLHKSNHPLTQIQRISPRHRKSWSDPQASIGTPPSVSEAPRHTSVYIEHVPVDEARRVRGQKDCRADQLMHLAPAAERRLRGELLVLDERLVQFGAKISRRQRVGAKTMLAPAGRHALGQHFHGVF
jgi:hypothetical protein